MTFSQCRVCGGTGQTETLVAYKDEPAKMYQYKCRGCRGTGQVRDREFVAPETVTWCIDETSAQAHRVEGLLLTKAHHVKVVDGWHKPACGAQVAHTIDQCVSAPAGWPQCRRCSLRPKTPVPSVFEE